MNKRKKGAKAEELVAKFLSEKGYEILDRNFTIQGGEIDIVSKLEEEIVFVEVKSLANENTIFLEETITEKKTKTLIRACKYWLKSKNFDNIDWRIDFVGLIVHNDKIQKLKHFKNAIY